MMFSSQEKLSNARRTEAKASKVINNFSIRLLLFCDVVTGTPPHSPLLFWFLFFFPKLDFQPTLDPIVSCYRDHCGE